MRLRKWNPDRNFFHPSNIITNILHLGYTRHICVLRVFCASLDHQISHERIKILDLTIGNFKRSFDSRYPIFLQQFPFESTLLSQTSSRSCNRPLNKMITESSSVFLILQIIIRVIVIIEADGERSAATRTSKTRRGHNTRQERNYWLTVWHVASRVWTALSFIMRYRRCIQNGSRAYRSKAASRSVHRSVGTLFHALTCTCFANVGQTGRKKRNSRCSSASIPCFSPLSSIIDRYFLWFSADSQRELKKKETPRDLETHATCHGNDRMN